LGNSLHDSATTNSVKAPLLDLGYDNGERLALYRCP